MRNDAAVAFGEGDVTGHGARRQHGCDAEQRNAVVVVDDDTAAGEGHVHRQHGAGGVHQIEREGLVRFGGGIVQHRHGKAGRRLPRLEGQRSRRENAAAEVGLIRRAGSHGRRRVPLHRSGAVERAVAAHREGATAEQVFTEAPGRVAVQGEPGFRHHRGCTVVIDDAELRRGGDRAAEAGERRQGDVEILLHLGFGIAVEGDGEVRRRRAGGEGDGAAGHDAAGEILQGRQGIHRHGAGTGHAPLHRGAAGDLRAAALAQHGADEDGGGGTGTLDDGDRVAHHGVQRLAVAVLPLEAERRRVVVLEARIDLGVFADRVAARGALQADEEVFVGLGVEVAGHGDRELGAHRSGGQRHRAGGGDEIRGIGGLETAKGLQAGVDHPLHGTVCGEHRTGVYGIDEAGRRSHGRTFDRLAHREDLLQTQGTGRLHLVVHDGPAVGRRVRQVVAAADAMARRRVGEDDEEVLVAFVDGIVAEAQRDIRRHLSDGEADGARRQHAAGEVGAGDRVIAACLDAPDHRRGREHRPVTGDGEHGRGRGAFHHHRGHRVDAELGQDRIVVDDLRSDGSGGREHRVGAVEHAIARVGQAQGEALVAFRRGVAGDADGDEAGGLARGEGDGAAGQHAAGEVGGIGAALEGRHAPLHGGRTGGVARALDDEGLGRGGGVALGDGGDAAPVGDAEGRQAVVVVDAEEARRHRHVRRQGRRAHSGNEVDAEGLVVLRRGVGQYRHGDDGAGLAGEEGQRAAGEDAADEVVGHGLGVGHRARVDVPPDGIGAVQPAVAAHGDGAVGGELVFRPEERSRVAVEADFRRDHEVVVPHRYRAGAHGHVEGMGGGREADVEQFVQFVGGIPRQQDGEGGDRGAGSEGERAGGNHAAGEVERIDRAGGGAVAVDGPQRPGHGAGGGQQFGRARAAHDADQGRAVAAAGAFDLADAVAGADLDAVAVLPLEAQGRLVVVGDAAVGNRVGGRGEACRRGAAAGDTGEAEVEGFVAFDGQIAGQGQGDVGGGLEGREGGDAGKRAGEVIGAGRRLVEARRNQIDGPVGRDAGAVEAAARNLEHPQPRRAAWIAFAGRVEAAQSVRRFVVRRVVHPDFVGARRHVVDAAGQAGRGAEVGVARRGKAQRIGFGAFRHAVAEEVERDPGRGLAGGEGDDTGRENRAGADTEIGGRRGPHVVGERAGHRLDHPVDRGRAHGRGRVAPFGKALDLETDQAAFRPRAHRRAERDLEAAPVVVEDIDIGRIGRLEDAAVHGIRQAHEEHVALLGDGVAGDQNGEVLGALAGGETDGAGGQHAAGEVGGVGAALVAGHAPDDGSGARQVAAAGDGINE